MITRKATRQRSERVEARDTPDTLAPEIMEDVARLMFVGLTGLANDRGVGR